MRLPLDYNGSIIRDADGVPVDRECDKFYPGHDPIRKMVIAAIREFVSANKKTLSGRTLDFGCGRPGTCRVPQPYRDLVTGSYCGVDADDELPNEKFDAVLFTEVIQMLDNPDYWIKRLSRSLAPGGRIVATFIAAWPEIEPASLWRFTATGGRKVFEAWFDEVRVEPLAYATIGGLRFDLVHGLTGAKA